MNFDLMVKWGLMRRLSTGEYVLTIKGQRIYSGKPDWKPADIRPEPQDKSLSQMLLDAGLPNELEWEDEPNRTSD